MAGRLKPPGHGTLDFPNSEDVRIEEWRVAVSLNGNPLPRVDVAENGLRERQHCPWREEFFKLIAILPRQTIGEVFARIGRAARRGCKYTDAGMAATQLLLPKIHEIETRRDRHPLRAQDRQQTIAQFEPIITSHCDPAFVAIPCSNVASDPSAAVQYHRNAP